MNGKQSDTVPAGDVTVSELGDGAVALRFEGHWTIHSRVPALVDIRARAGAAGAVRRVVLDGASVAEWDSVLLTTLRGLGRLFGDDGVAVDASQLPDGVRRLLDLASAVPPHGSRRDADEDESLLHDLGARFHQISGGVIDVVAFVGEASAGVVRFLVGRARYRGTDFWLTVRQCGADALPIVSLISVLVGVILAFVGAVQLQQFGAQIFVANLVGISMAREMGALMTGIIMAGRTGAAFAAQIGTMQVNEEVDALVTTGIPPVDFLVTPRMMALILMMPLLSIYAAVLGIVGGLFVGVTMLDVPAIQYLNQTRAALGVGDFAVGVVKSGVFGILIAVAGCYCGIRCGRSASAVGGAATTAVVATIVAIVVADGLFAVITTILGI